MFENLPQFRRSIVCAIALATEHLLHPDIEVAFATKIADAIIDSPTKQMLLSIKEKDFV